MSPDRERRRLKVQGIVQGVGFRPFVYGLATRFGLAGHVGNNGQGVFIEVEGATAALDAFRLALIEEVLPPARIELLMTETIPSKGETAFTIVASEPQAMVSALIPPDLAICADCLRELFDPSDRRYRYPFINCTHCGPRFTIIERIPYDRSATTMAAFTMCPQCAAEYHDPRDRRFHAQPNACPVCGPQVWFQRHTSPQAAPAALGDSAIEATKAALRHGEIVAVKGLGGFHLACDATDDLALARLRERKGRVDKPFAVMARDLDAVRQLAWVSADEARLLSSRQRPILLLRKRPDSPLSAGVAPGNPCVGVMLPYTPLHYLLMDDRPLVMTSGNLSGEPIVSDNEMALERLGPLADAFLLHDRAIQAHCDDSVIRVYAGRELPVRRSRGYTPFPVHLPIAAEPVLATGGELKNTFCLTHERHAFMSQHIGDMENWETLDAFSRAYEHLRTLYALQPRAVVCDLHPGYLTTQWAERYTQSQAVPLLKVQHHHAHVAALMAEKGLDGRSPVIGVCFDGTGYGTDGAIWGGEFLIADYAGFERAAHLSYVPLPGGDATIRRPYRAALAHLWATKIAWEDNIPAVATCSATERRILMRQFETGFQTVPCSSMGRFFDAVAALIGVRHTVTYEAQAAIELEGLVQADADAAYPFELIPHEGKLLLNPARVIREIVADIRADVPVGVIAGRFHLTVAQMVSLACRALRNRYKQDVVALTGGVFQNVCLLDLTVRELHAHGFRVLTHEVVPPNDGGLALGQAVIGAHQIANGTVE